MQKLRLSFRGTYNNRLTGSYLSSCHSSSINLLIKNTKLGEKTIKLNYLTSRTAPQQRRQKMSAKLYNLLNNLQTLKYQSGQVNLELLHRKCKVSIQLEKCRKGYLNYSSKQFYSILIHVTQPTQPQRVSNRVLFILLELSVVNYLSYGFCLTRTRKVHN